MDDNGVITDLQQSKNPINKKLYINLLSPKFGLCQSHNDINNAW